MAGRALGVLLAVAVVALLAAADDDKTQPWKCFRTCARGCHHHHDNGSSAAVAEYFHSGDANVSAVSDECKNGCQEDACFKDLPAISDTQCAMATCLSHPHRMCTVKAHRTIDKQQFNSAQYGCSCVASPARFVIVLQIAERKRRA